MTTAIALAADYTNLLQLLESSDELRKVRTSS